MCFITNHDTMFFCNNKCMSISLFVCTKSIYNISMQKKKMFKNRIYIKSSKNKCFGLTAYIYIYIYDNYKLHMYSQSTELYLELQVSVPASSSPTQHSHHLHFKLKINPFKQMDAVSLLLLSYI